MGQQKIKISFDGHEITATLYDSPANRDFVELLPLSLTLDDFGAEKAADLPEQLSVYGTPVRYTPAAGDITYFTPWQNLAIFYEDFRSVKGLVLLGKIDGDPNAFKKEKHLDIKIELL